MPFLTEEERTLVNTSLETSKRIRDSFADRQYASQHCRLCGWASNGLTFDQALEVSRSHEQTHPEYAEWTSSAIPIGLLQRSMHDHECQTAPCACKCGCIDSAGCIVGVFAGPLCAVCSIRTGRGDTDHGRVEDAGAE